MARKKTTKKIESKKEVKKKKLKLIEKKKSLGEKLNLKDEVIHTIAAAILAFSAIFLLAAPSSSAGPVGNFLYTNLSTFMGVGYYLLPLLFVVLSVAFFKSLKKKFSKVKYFGSLLFMISSLGFMDIVFSNGGWLGNILSMSQSSLGKPMAILLAAILFFISLVIIFDGIPSIRRKEKKVEYTEELSEKEEAKIDQIALSAIKKGDTAGRVDETATGEKKKPFKISGFEKEKSKKESTEMTKNITSNTSREVILPPLNLLSKDKGKPDAGDIKSNANMIKSSLASFGISVEIDSVSVGPTVTRFALKPAQGVRVSKIAALKDDLALALSAKSIIIQTPIPGESLVGIEIPNRTSTMVGAGSLFSEPAYLNSGFQLPLAIGRGIDGKSNIIAMEKTPHMLIAGATGAGKSVTVHAIINSLLYKHGPDTLKLILIDPKRVEMTLYNGIPHLLTPVIVDSKKAILSLRWAVNEMERRYEVLEKERLRDIDSYHKNVLEKAVASGEQDLPEAMPYIVIVIDELADIMQQYPKELESGIVSIAQKARAVGIHLILSTQRPSVNVVTGLIKANIPTRLALQVSSAIDSKTILDMAGAENLLGKGDMLYMTGSMAKPVRVQSSYISEDEVKSVVKFIKKAYKDTLGEDINLELGEGGAQHAQEVSENIDVIDFDAEDDFDQDPMLKAAVEEVMTSRKASTTYLQRKLGIGYARAAKLIDILEEKNIIGPANGSKPREVLPREDSQ